MSNTVYLNPSWDMCLDSNGNIALAGEPYALAQDAASAIQIHLGECRYDTKLGIDYFGTILGKSPIPVQLMRTKFVAEAMRVPGVASAQVFFSALNARAVSGQVQVKSLAGVVSAVTISPVINPSFGFGSNPLLDTRGQAFVLNQSLLG